MQEWASHRLDDIYCYNRDWWGNDQAEKYVTGLFAFFDKIVLHGASQSPCSGNWRRGIFFRYERHFVYLRHLSIDDIGIVTLLHERLHQIDRFRDDFGIS